jgi:hypothetical protein
MKHPTDTTTARNTTAQAALTAFALERIAAQLLALMPSTKGDTAAAIEEAAAEIWAHSDALLHAATDADVARLTGANARVIR